MTALDPHHGAGGVLIGRQRVDESWRCPRLGELRQPQLEDVDLHAALIDRNPDQPRPESLVGADGPRVGQLLGHDHVTAVFKQNPPDEGYALHRAVGQRHVLGRHEKGTTAAAKRLEDAGDGLHWSADDFCQGPEAMWATDPAVVRAALGQRLEDPLHNHAELGSFDGVVDHVRMQGERPRQPAGLLVVSQVDRFPVVPVLAPDIPHPHQGVLEHR